MNDDRPPSNLNQPLALGSFRNWLRLLRANGGVDRKFLRRAGLVSAISLLTAGFRCIDRTRHRRRHRSGSLVLGGWLIIPMVSFAAPLYDEPVMTVRHMQSQVGFQIGTVIGGYVLLAALRYRWTTIVYLFGVGCMLGFMMELPLLVTKIRPTSFQLLAFETVILFNQGVPYLYVFWDKVLPRARSKAASAKDPPEET